MAEAMLSSAVLPAPTTLRSPFAAVQRGRWPDRQGQVGVHLQAQTLGSVTLLSTWLGGAQALVTTLQGVLGLLGEAADALPARPGECRRTPQGLLVCTTPEDFLLIDDTPHPARCVQWRSALLPDVGSVTDLSHARCRIRVSGAQTCTTLNKLFALDLRLSAFPVGQARLSGTHHVPSLLVRTAEQAFDWIVFTTYAQDQLETLIDAAREFGVELLS